MNFDGSKTLVLCAYLFRCCLRICYFHYNDVIMGAMASQITSVTIVCSTAYSGEHQRKYQSSALLAFVRGIHPAQRASNAENVWWRHHVDICMTRYNVWGTWLLHLEFGRYAEGCHKTFGALAITFDGHRVSTAKITNVKNVSFYRY